MKKQVLLLCFTLLGLFNGLNAQSDLAKRAVDSLIRVAETLPADTNKAWMYCSISNQIRQLNFEQSLHYGRKALQLAQKLNYRKGIYCGYNNQGITHYFAGNYDSAIIAFSAYRQLALQTSDSLSLAYALTNIGNVYIDKGNASLTQLYYDSALQIRLRIFDTASITQSYVNLGYINKEMGNYTKALLYLYKSAKLIENNPNQLNSLAYTYNFISTVYSHKNDHEKAIQFARKALVLYEKLRDINNIAICKNVIGTAYFKLAKFDTSYVYLTAAYLIYQQQKDLRQLSIITGTLSELSLLKNNYQYALDYALKSISYHHAIGNKRIFGTAYLHAAEALYKQRKPALAKTYADSAYRISKETGELTITRSSLKLLKELAYELKNYEQAYRYAREFISVNDSIEAKNNEKIYNELTIAYETEKKDLEITNKTLELTQAQYELNKRKAQLIASVILALLIALTSWLFYTRYKHKQELILQHERLNRSKEIIEAEEAERTRVARELHDGIGQQLSAVKLNLSALEGKLHVDDALASQFKNTVSMLDDAVKEVRTVSHNLMPNALIKSGLVSAVREFLNQVSNSGVVDINLNISGLNQRMKQTTEHVLYRVLQECVSNIIKHAKASHVEIQLLQFENELTLMIEDDGVGFDTKQASFANGIGIKNMLSRIEFLNGSIEFDSLPGRGTTITIKVPFEPEA